MTVATSLDPAQAATVVVVAVSLDPAQAETVVAASLDLAQAANVVAAVSHPVEVLAVTLTVGQHFEHYAVCNLFFLDFGVSQLFKYQFSFVEKFFAFKKTEQKDQNNSCMKHDDHYSNDMQNANIQVEGIG